VRDAALLQRKRSHVIHDWDEESCLRFLENCRNAMTPQGHLNRRGIQGFSAKGALQRDTGDSDGIARVDR
jgi:hypothetical protein